MLKQEAKFTRAHKLLGNALDIVLSRKKLLGGFILVAVTVHILLNSFLSEAAQTLYQSLWLGIVSTGIIWMLRHLKKKSPPHIRDAYYQGTAPLVKFYLILVVVGLASLPFSIGGWLYATLNFLAVEGNLALDILFAGIWISLTAFSLLIVVRLLPALIIVTLPDALPLKSITASWKLTRGHTYTLSGRFLVFIIYSLLLIVVLSLVLSALRFNAQTISTFLELVGLGVILPLFYTYLWQIYNELI